MRWLLRSKIHKAKVTEANLNYIGSITIDEDLMEKLIFGQMKSFSREQYHWN